MVSRKEQDNKKDWIDNDHSADKLKSNFFIIFSPDVGSVYYLIYC